jgi:hypothetical protein
MMVKPMGIREWHATQFVPWQQAMAKYKNDQAQQLQKLKDNAGSLQTIVAMLLEGKTKAALLAWNTLQLHPKLRDIRLGSDGETLTLVPEGALPVVLKLDDLLDELQQILDA